MVQILIVKPSNSSLERLIIVQIFPLYQACEVVRACFGFVLTGTVATLPRMFRLSCLELACFLAVGCDGTRSGMSDNCIRE